MCWSVTWANRTRTGSAMSVEADVADAGQVLADLVTAGAAVACALAEDQGDVVAFGQPQRDPGREQVADGQDLLARVLHRPDHADADRAALGQQQRQRGGDPSFGVPVDHVGGQRGELVDDHQDQRLLDGRGVQPGPAPQVRLPATASPPPRPPGRSRTPARTPPPPTQPRSRCRRGRRRRTGRTGRGRGRAPSRPWGPGTTPPPTPRGSPGPRACRVDQITDPFPDPVAPTTRTWVPSSRSRYGVPSSHSPTGTRARSTPAEPATPRWPEPVADAGAVDGRRAVVVGCEGFGWDGVGERVGDQEPQLEAVPDPAWCGPGSPGPRRSAPAARTARTSRRGPGRAASAP